MSAVVQRKTVGLSLLGYGPVPGYKLIKQVCLPSRTEPFDMSRYATSYGTLS